MRSSILALATLCASFAAATSIPAFPKRSRGCSNETVISQETLESGVVLTQRKCHDSPVTTPTDVGKRGTFFICNEGDQCDTTCYSGSGGPNQNDCQTIVNVIAGNQNDIVIWPQTSWTYTWNSCEARFFNQDDSTNLDICASAFSGTVEWLAGDCNGANGAQGGKCISPWTTGQNPNIQLWFIDVIHS